MNDYLAALEYMATLFADASDDRYVELRGMPTDDEDHIVRHFWPASDDGIVAAARTAMAWRSRRDVYVCVNLRARRQGQMDGIDEVRWVYADYDHTSDPAEIPVPAGLPPTMVVKSGKGLHAYWKLCEPFPIRTSAERTSFSFWQRKFVSIVSGDPCATDPARLLRVPATLNHKYDPPRSVDLVSNEEVEYHIDELTDYAGNIPPPFVPPPPRVYRDEDRTIPSAARCPAPSGTWFSTACRIAGRMRQQQWPYSDIRRVLIGHAELSGKNDQSHLRKVDSMAKWASRQTGG